MATHVDQPVSRFFVSQGLRLHYADWGNDGAPLVVLVHGGRDHARSWDWVARELRGDYHVVAPDLRGHGDSEWSPDAAYAQPFLIADLANLIADLGRDDVFIVAHSFGGSISLRYTALFPAKVRRIAAIEGIGIGSARTARSMTEKMRAFVAARLETERREPRRYPTLAAAVARMQEANLHLSAAQVDHLTEHGVRRNPDGSYGWKFDRMLNWPYPVDIAGEELRDLWRRIECPVWLVHGADSWAAHPDEDGRSAEFRDVRVTSFADAGHWVQHDRFVDFTRELKAFLAG